MLGVLCTQDLSYFAIASTSVEVGGNPNQLCLLLYGKYKNIQQMFLWFSFEGERKQNAPWEYQSCLRALGGRILQLGIKRELPIFIVREGRPIICQCSLELSVRHSSRIREIPSSNARAVFLKE
jgi:hypothetical protein